MSYDNETEEEEITCEFCGTTFDSEDQYIEHLRSYEPCKTKYEAQLEKLSQPSKKEESFKDRMRKRFLLKVSKESPRRIRVYETFPDLLEKDLDREIFFLALKTKGKDTDSLTPLSKKIQDSRFEDLYREINEFKKCPSCGLSLEEIQKENPEIESIIQHLHESKDPNHQALWEEYIESGKAEKDFQKWVAEKYPKKKRIYTEIPEDQLSKEIEELSEEDLDRLLTKMLRKNMKRR